MPIQKQEAQRLLDKNPNHRLWRKKICNWNEHEIINLRAITQFVESLNRTEPYIRFKPKKRIYKDDAAMDKRINLTLYTVEQLRRHQEYLLT